MTVDQRCAKIHFVPVALFVTVVSAVGIALLVVAHGLRQDIKRLQASLPAIVREAVLAELVREDGALKTALREQQATLATNARGALAAELASEDGVLRTTVQEDVAAEIKRSRP